MNTPLYVILDLNGVLMARVDRKFVQVGRKENKFFPKSFDYSVLSGKSKVYVRPYAREFLENILMSSEDKSNPLSHIRLATWTSAKPKTERELITKLIPKKVLDRLVFRWTRDNCKLVKRKPSSSLPSLSPSSNTNSSAIKTTRQTGTKESLTDGVVEKNSGWNKVEKSFLPIALKPLSKVFGQFPESMNAKNTLIIDDSLEKMPETENALIIPEYAVCKPDFECQRDDVLVRLQDYLKDFVNNTEEITDIRVYLKERPFIHF